MIMRNDTRRARRKLPDRGGPTAAARPAAGPSARLAATARPAAASRSRAGIAPRRCPPRTSRTTSTASSACRARPSRRALLAASARDRGRAGGCAAAPNAARVLDLDLLGDGRPGACDGPAWSCRTRGWPSAPSCSIRSATSRRSGGIPCWAGPRRALRRRAADGSGVGRSGMTSTPCPCASERLM